jgi:hypothetical protein
VICSVPFPMEYVICSVPFPMVYVKTELSKSHIP